MISERGKVIRTLLLAALCLFILTTSGSAAADDPSEDAVYKELIEQALSEFKHKNWPEARSLFTRAHELNPNARTMRSIGIVSFEMRDYVSAVVHLKAALEDARQPLNEAQRKECDALLTRARAYVGVFALTVEPAGAEVQLDGATPTLDEEGRLMVPFGEHTLSARAPGYQEGSTRLVVQGGERGEVTLSLLPESAPAPSVATTGAVPPTQPAADTSTKNNVRVSPPREPPGFIGGGLKYTWVALGASALFGGAAALMWTLGDKELGKLDDDCRARAAQGNPCTPSNTSTSEVDRFEKLTNASIGLSAGALVAAGVLMGLEWPRERNLTVGFSHQALFVRGAF